MKIRCLLVFITTLLSGNVFALGPYWAYKSQVKQFITISVEQDITAANQWLTNKLTKLNDLEKEISLIYHLSRKITGPQADFLGLQKRYLSMLTKADPNHFRNKSALLKVISKSYLKQNEIDKALNYAKLNLQMYVGYRFDNRKTFSEYLDAQQELLGIFKVQRDHNRAIKYFETLLSDQNDAHPAVIMSMRPIIDYLATRYVDEERMNKLKNWLDQHRLVESNIKPARHLTIDRDLYGAGCVSFLFFQEHETAEEFCKAELELLKIMYQANRRNNFYPKFKLPKGIDWETLSENFHGNYLAALKGQGKYKEAREIYERVRDYYNASKEIQTLNSIDSPEFFKKSKNAPLANFLGRVISFYVSYAQFEIRTARYENATALTKEIEGFLTALNAKAGDWGQGLANSYWPNLIALKRTTGSPSEWVGLARKLLDDKKRKNNSSLNEFSMTLANYFYAKGQKRLARRYANYYLESKPSSYKASRGLLLLDKINGVNNSDSIYKTLIESLEQKNKYGSGYLVMAYNEYGLYLNRNNKPAKAEIYYKRALDLLRNGNLKYVAKKRSTYQITRNLFFSLFDQGKYQEAEKVIRRVLLDVEKGHFHRRKAYLLGDLGKIAYMKKDLEKSNDFLSDVYEYFRDVNELDQIREKSHLTERRIVRNLGTHFFPYYLSVLWFKDKFENKTKSFEILQESIEGRTGIDLERGRLVRYLPKNSEKRMALEEYHERLVHFNKMADQANHFMNIGDGAVLSASDAPLKRFQKAKSQLVGARREVNTVFPEYLNLITPRVITPESVSNSLELGEVLISFLFYDQESFVWAIDKEGLIWERLNITRDQLEERVKTIRSNLILSNPGVRGAEPVEGDNGFASKNLTEFLVGAAELYNILFDKVQAKIDQAERVVFVPNISLKPIPLSVLITEKPELSDDPSLEELRSIRWLGVQKAIFEIPSISSIETIRKARPFNLPDKEFIGFGDPDFKGDYRPLPDSEFEINRIADTLGAEQGDRYLRKRATEYNFKSTNLEQYRVISVATHGLLEGDLPGINESALVFTKPERLTNEDDGLLTANEIATLNINADWVILSACNTAIEKEEPDSVGFAGLSQPFLFAGARSILASHWPVHSSSAVKLTTAIFELMSGDSELSRAEALRRSMLNLIGDDENSNSWHPFFWAPFVIVGEGN